MPDFLPRRDAELADLATAIGRRLVDEPGVYPLAAGRAEAVTVAAERFTRLLRIARSPSGGTRVATGRKAEARAALEAVIRPVAWTLRGTNSVDDAALRAIGLRRASAKRARHPVPTRGPILEVLRVDGRSAAMRAHDPANAGHVAKPARVASVRVMCHVCGDADGPPWRLAGQFTRTRFAVELPRGVPAGTRLWLRGFYQNGRGEPGPAGPAAGVRVPFAEAAW